MKQNKTFETMIVLVGALIVGYLFLPYREILWTALGIIVISIFWKWLANKISWVWLKFSEIIGFIMSKFLLTIIFYVILFPLALLYRISTKDKLQLKKTNNVSYFKERNYIYKASDLKNIW